MSNPALEDLTNKRVLAIAVPIVLAYITIPILGLVDTAVVGQLGLAAPIGAVGLGAVIISGLYWLFGFLRMGTTGLTAQAHGAQDAGEVRALLLRALMIAGLAGVALILAQAPLFWLAFKASPASQEVENLTRSYLSIRIYSAPAAIALFGISGWLIALEKARAVLVLQLWLNGLNILLDVVFVLGLGWGVPGVAIATFIAEYSGLLLGLNMCRKYIPGGLVFERHLVLNMARLKHMASVNFDIMLRSILLQISFMSFLFFGAGLGDRVLAANQILIQFLTLSAYALDGFAFAAETFVGQAFGAKRAGALRRVVILTSKWAGGLVIGFSLAIWLFGHRLIEFMTTAQDVRDVAFVYLPWLIAAPIIGGASWMLDGIFIGATRTRDMRNMMFLSFLVYGLAIWLLMPVFGNHGLWASLMIFNATRGLTLGLKYPALEAAARKS